MGQDVFGESCGADDVLDTTERLVGGIEVIDSRYEAFKFTLADVIADNTSAAQLAIGSEGVAPTRRRPARDRMHVHGRRRSHGSGDRCRAARVTRGVCRHAGAPSRPLQPRSARRLAGDGGIAARRPPVRCRHDSYRHLHPLRRSHGPRGLKRRCLAPRGPGLTRRTTGCLCTVIEGPGAHRTRRVRIGRHGVRDDGGSARTAEQQQQ